MDAADTLADRLLDHPVFRRLTLEDRRILISEAELWESPAGARIQHSGDAAEEILLLLEGRWMEGGEDETTKRELFPGDLWGADRLAEPRPIEFPMISREACRWLRWTKESLMTLSLRHRSLGTGLRPLHDRDGQHLSGLPGWYPVQPRKTTRRFKPSLRPQIAWALAALMATGFLGLLTLLRTDLSPSLPWAAPVIYAVSFLSALAARSSRDYVLADNHISTRVFDWSRFIVERRRVPMDTIQGVDTVKKGVLRKFLDYGTVRVQTSAVEGVLELRDVTHPDILRRGILARRDAGRVRDQGRDRESWRRDLEAKRLDAAVPRLISAPEPVSVKNGTMRFRKSLAVLLGRIILPLLSLAALLLIALFVFPEESSLHRAAFMTLILPAFWVFWRVEDWRNDLFLVEGGYAVDLTRRPLGLRETRRQVELMSVQNIRTEQKGLLPFLFRYGDVVLVTMGGAADVVFRQVSQPWSAQEKIFHLRELEIRRREDAERERMRDNLLRFAEAMEQAGGTSLEI